MWKKIKLSLDSVMQMKKEKKTITIFFLFLFAKKILWRRIHHGVPDVVEKKGLYTWTAPNNNDEKKNYQKSD